jgi:hypothetical protein
MILDREVILGNKSCRMNNDLEKSMEVEADTSHPKVTRIWELGEMYPTNY